MPSACAEVLMLGNVVRATIIDWCNLYHTKPNKENKIYSNCEISVYQSGDPEDCHLLKC